MNKKGGTIVEAAMIFPVVVLSVAALISIMTYFYLQLEERIDMHMMLRAESGLICNNMFYGNDYSSSFPVYKKAQQLYSEGDLSFRGNGLLNGHNKKISARKYLINETAFVRMSEAVRDGVSVDD